MNALRVPSLVVATISTGLVAGLFYGWSVSVMPGLSRTDDHTYLAAMQEMNRAIYNGWFFLTFMGSLLFIVAALLLNLRGGRGAVPWIGIALVLYLAVLVITFAVNIPVNNELDTAGAVDQIANPAELRDRFEGTWVTGNIVRALVNTAAFGSLVWGLVRLRRPSEAKLSGAGADAGAAGPAR